MGGVGAQQRYSAPARGAALLRRRSAGAAGGRPGGERRGRLLAAGGPPRCPSRAGPSGLRAACGEPGRRWLPHSAGAQGHAAASLARWPAWLRQAGNAPAGDLPAPARQRSRAQRAARGAAGARAGRRGILLAARCTLGCICTAHRRSGKAGGPDQRSFPAPPGRRSGHRLACRCGVPLRPRDGWPSAAHPCRPGSFMAPRIAAAPLSRVRLSLGSALKGLGLDRPHCRVLLAASGGPDSAALLAAFASLPEGRRPQAVAAHVDHGLHPAAAAAAIAVQRQAERFGLRLRLAALSRGSAPGLRFGSEAWARAGRYASLVDLAGQEGAQAILTAHHRDDQIETLVLRLLRKAGTRGLGGMPAVRWLAGGLLLVRPLLDQPRALLAQVVCAEGLGPLVVEDPTNRDERSLRNRVRHRLLPQLRNALHPGADALLAEVASVLRRAADLQAASVERLDRLLVADLPDGGCVIEARGLAALPPALQASLLLDRLHRLERRCEPRRVHVEALLVLAGRAAGR
ncbi:MAG: tRNA lysidine(34) synthetase TilS, partial [Deltaproteobacteria bacterium]|nr:tRNA lysidine(34) synthetase TilS [Deltaproteobacteria bacterium]